MADDEDASVKAQVGPLMLEWIGIGTRGCGPHLRMGDNNNSAGGDRVNCPGRGGTSYSGGGKGLLVEGDATLLGGGGEGLFGGGFLTSGGGDGL